MNSLKVHSETYAAFSPQENFLFLSPPSPHPIISLQMSSRSLRYS